MNRDLHDSELQHLIQEELNNTRLLVRRIERRSAEVIHAKPDRSVLMRTAGYLHSFSFGVERVFKIIARYIDHMEPHGKSRQRRLLHQMAKEVEGTRPPLISAELASQLEEYTKIRELIHNKNRQNIDWNSVIPKVGEVRSVYAQVENSVNRLLGIAQ